MIDAHIFPAVAAYVGALPDGLDSHPTCQAKASLYRALLDFAPLAPGDLAGLPPVLVDLARHPAPVSSWIPEVRSHAMMLAVYDRAFPDLEAFAEHAYASQRALFNGPLYAIAMRLASPNMLIKTAALRWRLFHRGMVFQPILRGSGEASVELEYPPAVYEPILLRALCEAIRAILELSTLSGAEVRIVRCGSTSASLAARWQP